MSSLSLGTDRPTYGFGSASRTVMRLSIYFRSLLRPQTDLRSEPFALGASIADLACRALLFAVVGSEAAAPTMINGAELALPTHVRGVSPISLLVKVSDLLLLHDIDATRLLDLPRFA